MKKLYFNTDQTVKVPVTMEPAGLGEKREGHLVAANTFIRRLEVNFGEERE